LLKTISEGENTTRPRGLLWNVEEAAHSEGGGGPTGDIDSVAPTTARAGDQVKEGGRAPTDCSLKRKAQRQ